MSCSSTLAAVWSGGSTFQNCAFGISSFIAQAADSSRQWVFRVRDEKGSVFESERRATQELRRRAR